MRPTAVVWCIVLCFPCLFVPPHAWGSAAETAAADSALSIQEGIDPLREDAGDFLDFDLAQARALAFQAYQQQDYEEAARRYLIVLRQNIDDATSIYNLACCYGLMGEAALAAKYLQRAADAGFENLTHLMRDHDFDRVRGQEVFDAAVEAVAAQLLATRAEGGRIMYLGAPSLLPCRVRAPEDLDPEKSYRLVVGLHGVGDNPKRFIERGGNFGLPECIFVVPQAPYAYQTTTGIGYSWWLSAPQEEQVKDESIALSSDYVADMVDKLRDLYRISEVYLFGFSQGAAFSYQVGIRNPDLIDGIISFGGWLDTDRLTDDMIEWAKSLRVFIAHGRQDEANRFIRAEEAVDILSEHGYDVTFYPFDGGHELAADALRAATEWLASGDSDAEP
jgi:predicted esterase